MLSLKTRK